jgi:hypothetical protein
LLEELQNTVDELVLELISSERQGIETKGYWLVEYGKWPGNRTWRTRNEQREKLEIGYPRLGNGNL